MLTPKEYTVRPGTIDSGKLYEIKATALLSLKCCLKDLDHFWIASNVEECGDFDDIVLFKKERKRNGVTYLIQSKHQDNPTPITRKDILEGRKSKDFALTKYLGSYLRLTDAINDQSAEKSEFINHFKNHPGIIYIIFTNRDVSEELEFLELIRSSSDLVNINGNVYKFKLEKLSVFTDSDKRREEFIKNMFLYTKQPHIEKIDNKIKDIIRKLIAPISKPDKELEEIVKKFVFFIEDWYRGRLNGHYPLRKIQVLKKLTEIMLEPFIARFDVENAVQERCDVWDEIVEQKTLIVINGSDEIVDGFINRFICRFIFTHKQVVKECKTIRKELLRVPGNTQIISPLEVYEYLWKNQKIPLVIQVGSESEIEEVRSILKMCQGMIRIMLVNKSQVAVEDLKWSNELCAFSDLKQEQQEKLLKFSFRLQGRSLNGFKMFDFDLKEEISQLKVRDVIYLLCNKFQIGHEFEPLPDIYVDISFKQVWLKMEVLQEAFDDVFVIRCESLDFKEFLVSDDLDIDESEIIEWEDMDDFDSDYHRIILCEDLQNLEQIEGYIKKNNEKRSVHFLICNGKCKLEWVNSWGTIENLRRFRKSEKLEESGIPASKAIKDFFINIKPVVISSNPGMGKSVLINYIAQNAPTNFWVVKINLAKHKTVYKGFVNESECKLNLKTFFWKIIEEECKDNLFLAKAIFMKLYESKHIVVLLDGFDELPINYRNDAKQFIRFLNKCDYFVVVTTRPVLRNDLELLLNTFAINLNPFNRKDQLYFLENYFSRFSENSCKTEIGISFVESLLNAAQKNLNDCDNEFTGVPLQTLLLAEVFIEDFKTFLKTKTFINRNFDLLYLYKSFIEKKIQIACEKYGDISEDMIYQYKVCRAFCALRLVFSEDDLADLEIDSKLKVSKLVFPNMLELIQKDGIVVAETETNIRFVHQTFAEYLAGDWLTENIKNENKEIVRKLLKLTFQPSLRVVRNIFDRILARNLPLHLAVINFQMDKIITLIDSSHFDDLDDGNRSFIHLLASWGFQHPKKIKKHELFELKKVSNEDKFADILRSLPDDKLKNCKDQILENTPVDYSIMSNSLHIADILCQKLKNSQISISIENLLEPSLLPSCEEMNYLSLRREIINYINIDSKLFIDREDRDSFSFVISRGNIKKLNSIISRTSNLNEQDKFGSTPLHIAVRLQKEEIAKILLENGANKNMTDDSGRTPLHWSVIHGNLNISKLLISHGIDLNVLDFHKRTALHHSIISCRQNQIEIVSQLTNANFNLKDIYSMAPLILAADYGYTPVVKIFLEMGVDVEQKNKDKMTALHYAANNGYTDMVDLLLSKGADINSKTINGTTPLMLAAYHNYTKIINSLLHKGADIQTKDHRGRSALYWAACSGNKEAITLLINKLETIDNQTGISTLCVASQYGDKNIMNLLLSHGINIDSTDKKGRTPLHYAAFSGRKDIIKFLISKGAKINSEDNRGNTALYWAIRTGHFEVVKLLLSQSKQIKTPNNCLHVAAKYGHRNLINLFLLKGAEVNSKDEYDMTALHYAANDENFRTESAALLLTKGADIESKNNINETPLILAVKKGSDEMVDLLLAEGANLETKTNDNETPLIVSAKYGQDDVTGLLISKGSKFKVTDREGKTAFHWAAQNSYTTPEIIELFLSKSSDFLELQTLKQETPLILAAQGGSSRTVRLLLSKNVNIEAKDCNGMTALHWVSMKGYKNTLCILLQNDADLEAKDNKGRTALIFGSQNGHESIVSVLLLNEADPNVKDENGLTALEWAETNGHNSVVRLLKLTSVLY